MEEGRVVVEGHTEGGNIVIGSGKEGKGNWDKDVDVEEGE